MHRCVTRLAPSPTGALHLGNARTFLINWALARQSDWEIVLRMEDLDGPRVKAEASEQAMAILSWLGLPWDRGPFYQSTDLEPYRAALQGLARRGLSYPCPATRKEIEAAASAPHADAHESRYPGLYRPAAGRAIPPGTATATRLLTPEGTIAFDDRRLGSRGFDVQGQVGDFIIETKAGLPAYQLAVVVDDARQGVTEIVRGDDLLPSTSRQVLLYDLLGLAPRPAYTHLPLVHGPDGRRLAKRHGDTRLSSYRDAGVQPEQIVGLLAFLSGIVPRPVEMSAEQFAMRFDLDRLPAEAAVFDDDLEQWLVSRVGA